MEIKFSKYSGNGNDFVIIDNRNQIIGHSNQELLSKICHRKLGIGADGILLLENHDKFDYQMVYFNSDGKEASMCGNGARCLAHFYHTKILNKEIEEKLYSYEFKTLNSNYKIQIQSGRIQLFMTELYDENKIDLSKIAELTKYEDKFYINTGVPHLVLMVHTIETVDVKNEGRKIRNLEEFKPAGVNVNFFQVADNKLNIRTYERGVEDETLACGTGTVATAIFYHRLTNKTGKINFESLGGPLQVEIESTLNKVLFSGTVENTFNGTFRW